MPSLISKNLLIHRGMQRASSYYLGLSFNDSERHAGGGPLVPGR